MNELPCNPCPHQSACCIYGVSVTDEERATIELNFNSSFVRWDEEEQGWRTAVVDGRCIFSKFNICEIYGKPYYPEICSGVPFYQGTTQAPYESEVIGLCPEFEIRADLIPLVDPQTKRLRVIT